MAVFNMKVDPNVPISRALGFNPRGVLVDNITAYWLYFPQADAYCPPFTQGWSTPFMLNMAGYAYMEIKTPFGQTNQTNVTPNVSQFVNLVWTDDNVSFNPGQPSGSGFSIDPASTTPSVSAIRVAELTRDYISTGPNGEIEIIPATTGKRNRILTWDANLDRPDFGSWLQQQSSAETDLQDSTGSGFRYIRGIVSREAPSITKSFSSGLDYPVNEPVWVGGSAFWADTRVTINITYLVID